MIRIIQLSDLHVGQGHSESEHLKLITNQILSNYSNYEVKPHLIVSGDFVHHGTEAEYETVVDILAPLKEAGFKLLACPGNHDFGQGVPGHYKKHQPQCIPRYVEYIHKNLVKAPLDDEGNVIDYRDMFPWRTTVSLNGDNVLIIGIDSMKGVLDEEIHTATGKIKDDDKNDIRLLLQDPAYNGYTKIVYLHHHPYSNRAFMVLKKKREFRDFLSENGVELVCFGHLHIADTDVKENSMPRYVACGKSTEIEEDDNEDRFLKYQEIQIINGQIKLVEQRVEVE